MPPRKGFGYPAAALSVASGDGESTSDAPCRAPHWPGRARRPRSTRTASTAPTSTGEASPIRRAFHRQVLPCARSREREPATVLQALPPASQLPALFHPRLRSRARRLDPRRSPAFFTRVPRGPHAACRLLQSNTICEHAPRDRPSPAHHTRGRPRARLSHVSRRAALTSDRRSGTVGTPSYSFSASPLLRGGRQAPDQLLAAGGRAPFGAQPAERSRARGWHGQADACFSHCDRSQWKRYPNPIVSNTSCREHRFGTGWRSLCRGWPRRTHPRARQALPAFARPPFRAASRVPPRRGARSAAPEVSSTDRSSPKGLSLFFRIAVTGGRSSGRRLCIHRLFPSPDNGWEQQ